jgi:hypothetical protein
MDDELLIFFYHIHTEYYYYLQVVYSLDTVKTGYVTQISGVGSTIWAVLFGISFRQIKHIKKTCLFFVPVEGALIDIEERGPK